MAMATLYIHTTVNRMDTATAIIARRGKKPSSVLMNAALSIKVRSYGAALTGGGTKERTNAP